VARFTKRVRHPLRPPHRRRARQWTERTQPRRLQEREGEGEREEGVSDTRGSKRHSSSRWKEMGDSPPKTATRIHPKIGSLIPKGSLVPSPFNLLSTRAKAGEAVSVAAPTTAAASILGSSFLNTFFASANLSGLATADDEIDCIREKREKESERARERESESSEACQSKRYDDRAASSSPTERKGMPWHVLRPTIRTIDRTLSAV